MDAARARRLLCLGVLVLALAGSTALRIQLAFAEPGFDRERPERLLKSDPALLYWITGEIVAAGGGAPPGFRADRRIEHPEPSDLSAMLTVGQEFLTAWTWMAVGRPLPLHVHATLLWALVASLAGLGVYGAARELAGRHDAAALAVVLWAAAPASYRTAGMILQREDLSLPLFAIHGWLLLRGARTGRRGDFAWAGLALLGALASWHAMAFFVAVEVGCLFAWWLRSGRSPLARPGAWLVPAVVAVGSLGVPVLRSKGLLLSLPALLTAGLLVAAAMEGRAARPARTAAALACVAGLSLVAGALVSAGTLADYTHVFSLLAAKLRHLGELPADPRALAFEARLLWQGPFETGSIRELVAGFTVAVVLLPVAAVQSLGVWVRGEAAIEPGRRSLPRPAHAAIFVAFAVASVLLALLIRRNLAVATLAVPVAAAVVIAQLRGPGTRAWIGGIALAQLVACAGILPHRELRWYFPLHQEELAAVVGWIDAELPPGGAVATDFINGTAVLAHTGHPIALQPKYETRRSRERTRAFLEAFFHGSVGDLRALLDRWDCRYLLVDRQTLWQHRYLAGLPDALEQPVPGTAAAAFLSRDAVRLAAVPGFTLRYRSPLPSDMMRLFELR